MCLYLLCVHSEQVLLSLIRGLPSLYRGLLDIRIKNTTSREVVRDVSGVGILPSLSFYK